MSDHLQHVQIERNRLQHLLTEADAKPVRKTLRTCVQLIDSLLAQQHGSGQLIRQAVDADDSCPGQIAPGSITYMPPCIGCGRLATAKGSATMTPPEFGIKARRLHCPERVGSAA